MSSLSSPVIVSGEGDVPTNDIGDVPCDFPSGADSDSDNSAVESIATNMDGGSKQGISSAAGEPTGKVLTVGLSKSQYCAEEYADLVVRCRSATFKVHKAIICSRCEYFKRLCSGASKESGHGIIELQDQEELVAEAVLTFLYSWNYADFFVNGGGAAQEAFSMPGGDMALEQALFNIKVYVAAHKYSIVELQQQAAEVFGAALFRASGAAAPPPNSDSARASTTTTSSAPQLTPRALTDIADEVYNCVSSALPFDRLLRDIVCRVMSYHMHALLHERSFVALLDRGGGSCGIAADAARVLVQRIEPAQQRHRCPSCRGEFEAVIPARTFFQCYRCPFSTGSENWATHVVLPDIAAMWRAHQESRR